MALGKPITWGDNNPLSDPRLKDLDQYVNDIWEGRKNPNVSAGGGDGVHKNNEKNLPEKPEGYYREYYVEPKPAEGIPRSKLRLVLGAGGEVYVTGDHYNDMRQIIGMTIKVLAKKLAAKVAQEVQALAQLNSALQQLENLKNLYEGEHRGQLEAMNTSFAGFVANKLFNTPAPQIVIWVNAHGRLLALRREIRNKNVKRAFVELGQAKMAYMKAYRQYRIWKDGIELAARYTMIAIGATAFALVTLAVVGFAAAPAAAETGVLFAGAGAAEGAGGLTAAQQILVRIDAAVAQGTARIAAADAAALESELATSEAEVARLAQ